MHGLSERTVVGGSSSHPFLFPTEGFPESASPGHRSLRRTGISRSAEVPSRQCRTGAHCPDLVGEVRPLRVRTEDSVIQLPVIGGFCIEASSSGTAAAQACTSLASLGGDWHLCGQDLSNGSRGAR